MKYARWIVLAALLIAPAFLVVSYTREFLAVDSALDAGASYDYRAGRADFSRNHPVISFSARHGSLIAAATWSFAAAVVYGFTLYVWRDRKHRA
jgi:lysylphosphatidylglycerol synthetase-like protein (DUF2156 family)